VTKQAELVDRLKAIPLFMACSKDELRRIARTSSMLSYPAGSVLASEGQPGCEFMVIIDGRAEVSVGGRLVNTLGPDDFFGELALLDGGPRSATVTAATDVTIQAIEERDFRSLVYDSPALARKLLIGVAKRLRAANLTFDMGGPSAG
jgi:CRP/FNR family transcriptional regulator, cyclic AMP receptor protein